MSLSAALDAEAKELRREDEREKEEQKKRRASARNASPAPQSANSSTLDVGPNSPVTRHASIAGPTTGLTSSWARNLAPPKRNEDSESDDASAYDFVMGASAGKAAKPSKPNAMASVYGNTQVRLPGDLGASDPRRPKIPGDLGPNDPRRRRTSTAGPKSASPTGRSPRNMSPAISKLNQSSSAKNSLAPGAQSKLRRSSDAGFLGRSPRPGEIEAPDGGVRLQNDDDEDDEAVESSDDEDDMDTDASTDSRRGRRRTREGSSAAAKQSEIGEGEPGSSIDPEGEARKLCPFVDLFYVLDILTSSKAKIGVFSKHQMLPLHQLPGPHRLAARLAKAVCTRVQHLIKPLLQPRHPCTRMTKNTCPNYDAHSAFP